MSISCLWAPRGSLLAFCISLVLFAQPVAAQKVRAEPLLRVEAGMHTAAVSSIATDAQGRFLVTGSADKTARVWDVLSGSLLRTLRLPIGPGTEGQVHAVALSPDGHLIAVGGATGLLWDHKASIYLYDRGTGQMVRRIGGLPGAIAQLSFSSDGARLAAALDPGGVHVLRASSGEVLWHDAGCPAGAASVDLGRARLVTACGDGHVRLYDAAQAPIATWTAPDGKRPRSARLSPSGNKVAVGYDNNPQVDVLSGDDLHVLYAPDRTGVDRGLGVVAWSPDGELLYATGDWQADGGYPIRRWEGAGQGAYVDLHTSSDPSVALAALPRRQVAFGSSGPAWGVTGDKNQGKPDQLHVGPVADFRGLGAGLRLDESGASVRFAYQRDGQSPALFSVADRVLTLAPPKADKVPPDSPDTGPEPSLQAEAPVLARTRSGDGKLLLAALGDGTLRWYRADDGKELLALLLHADRRRWVLFTPAGYYDASAGGEDLLGWHQNQGPDQEADFFSAALLRDHLRRPDVIARVLRTLDEDRALSEADAAAGLSPHSVCVSRLLPPVVTILSPAESSPVSQSRVVVRVSVRSPSGEPVTWVHTLINGRAVVHDQIAIQRRSVRVDRPDRSQVLLRPGSFEHLITVDLPAEDSTLAVVAETAQTKGEPAAVHLRWSGTTFVIRPRLYMLAVGVSKYQRSELRLQYAAKDAADMAAEFRQQEGKLYRQVEARVLADKDATRAHILDGLEWLQRQTTAKDVAVLYLAGHGIAVPNSGEYYYLPYDADMQAIKRTMIFGGEVQATLKNTAGKVLVFLDTCHSGNVLGPGLRGGPDLTAFVNELSSSDNGVVVFASSTGRQGSVESPRWRNGAFTKALVEGLRGHAAYEQAQRITVNMLDLYLSERVKELTEGLQTPTTAKPALMPDFPVAVGEDGVRGRLVTAPSRPLYKKWWFWTALGAGVAAGIATGVALGTRSPCGSVKLNGCGPL